MAGYCGTTSLQSLRIALFQNNIKFDKYYDRIGMNHIKETATNKTPEVNFDYEQGLLELKGRSVPEVYYLFYNPLVNWVKEYIKNPQDITTLNVNLEYLNSGSITALYDIFHLLSKIPEQGKEVIVNWYYEEIDDITRDLGLELSERLPLQINLVEL